MHDGSLRTLEDVVEFYNKGGIPNKNLDANIRPLHLTDPQKSDLVAFLKSLSGEGWQSVKSPDRFPQ
jgi:cytochrome c peroxidase